MVLTEEMTAQHEEAQSGSSVSGGRRNSMAKQGGGGPSGETVQYVNEGVDD